MDNSFGSLIESASSILILLPKKPYFDQVAAGLALYLSLREKKEVVISCPAPMLVEFNQLVGVNKVTLKPENKNLTIKFVDYKAANIERVSYDIEDGQFKLTVVPKPGAPSPNKDQVLLSYSGVSADTLILVGGANEEHFPILTSDSLKGAKVVHIGTRALSVSSEKGVMSFARPASSVSEVISSLIKESGLTIDVDIATNLLMGIEEASGKFSSERVTADTFETVAELLRAGGKRKPKTVSPQGVFPTKIQPKEKPPKEWLAPKIYKGTTIS
jgi:nanoRNase/pAp phosphatase (c-di-AMP/oligoRNAs hydrolase)